MNIVNEVQEQELKRIGEGLKLFQDQEYKASCDLPLRKLLDEYIDASTGQIPRRLRQFRSDIVAAVVMGMLKAGKSTLVNLLARTSLASPVGFGVDTTLRPALITMADQGEDVGAGRICIYNAIDVDERRAFEQLLDYMRGIEAKLGMGLECQKVELSESNLRKALCMKKGNGLLEQEPLLVVVEVPYDDGCPLLKEKRMLLDMPGLDSAHAAIAASSPDAMDDESSIGCLYSRYESVIRECDLMVFVQSSVAPLNEKAATMLRNILSDRPSASCYIVQNAMRARYWRTEENQQREQEKQSDHAMAVIDRIIQQNASNSEHKKVSYVAPKMRTVNLGMAYDGLFAPEFELDLGRPLMGNVAISGENLRASSDFFDLECRMIDTLKTNGVRSRFIHCRGSLLATLRQALAAIARSRQEMEKEQGEAIATLQQWQQRKSETEQALDEGKHFSMTGDITMEEAMLPDFEVCKNTARAQVAAMAGGANIRVEEANEYLVKYKVACYAEAGKFISHDASLACLNIMDHEGRESALKFCNKKIDEALRHVELAPELHVQQLKKHLSHEGNPLQLDIEALGGFGGYNNDIERKALLQPRDGRSPSWDIFGWRRSISQEDGILKNKEEAYKDAFRCMVSKFICDHAKTRLYAVVGKGIDEGAEFYLKKLDEKINACHQKCARIEEGLDRRNVLMGKLNDFVNIVENLNA